MEVDRAVEFGGDDLDGLSEGQGVEAGDVVRPGVVAGAGEGFDGYAGDVFGVDEGLALVTERKRQLTGQDRGAEEALVEVLVEPVWAEDRPLEAGALCQVLCVEEAGVDDFGIAGREEY